jgi:CheY-like chemotaxis protein
MDPCPPDATAVLLVDDDEIVLQVGARMLARLGHQVLTADTGEAALEMLAAHPGKIGLVIFDLTMPGLGAGDLFERMRSAAPAARFLLASGYTRDEVVQGILDRGCNGFIQKPFRLEDLKGALDALLK